MPFEFQNVFILSPPHLSQLPSLAAYVHEKIPHLGRPRKVQCKEISLGLLEVFPSRRDVLALVELPRDVRPALQQLRAREPSLESIAVRIAVVRDARSWVLAPIPFQIHVSHHVSRMYPACILITLADTCIPHVSRMYPASQIRTSQDTFGIHVSHHVSWMYPSCILITLADTCIPHVSCMYPSCIARSYAFLLADVPPLKDLQACAKEIKRARTAAVHLEQLIDLKNLALRYFEPMPAPLTLMPPSGTQLAAQQTAAAVLPPVGFSGSASSSSTLRRVINVPMDCALYDTEGMCFTGPQQVQWIGQLLQRPQQFVLHADGKHKLHHGRWVLMTLGAVLRSGRTAENITLFFAK